jgi:hypothetical protein
VAGAVLLSGAALGQAQTLFNEDFENGLAGWTLSGSSASLWHVANPSECGSVTKMLAYNLGTSTCNYQWGSTHNAEAISPAFVLSGQAPFFISLKFARSVNSIESTGLDIEDITDGSVHGVTVSPPMTTNHSSIVQTSGGLPSGANAGHLVRLRFRITGDQFGNTGFGWLIDDIVVINSGCTDTDGDGTCDSNDGCPNDPNKIAPGQCGCGVADTDTDSDGIADCNDNCDTIANPSQADCDMDAFGDACDLYNTPGTIYVDCGYLGLEIGTPAQPFNTLAEAIYATCDNGEIVLAMPTCLASPITISKPLVLKANAGVVLIR